MNQTFYSVSIFTMSIVCNFLRHGKFCKLRILSKMANIRSPRSRQKGGIDLQPFQIFKTMMSVFYFRLGIGNSIRTFQRNLRSLGTYELGINVPCNAISWNFRGPQLSTQIEIFENCLQKRRRILLSLETRIF